MWECLVGFSTWAERNSGQIQILIAFGAIWLAIAGYKGVLKQIEIAKKQEHKLNEQKAYDLKIQSISLLLTTLERNQTTLKNLNKIVECVEVSIESYQNEMADEYREAKNNIGEISGKIKELEEIQKLIISICEEINRKDGVDYKTINFLYTALLGATKDAYRFEILYQKLIKD